MGNFQFSLMIMLISGIGFDLVHDKKRNGMYATISLIAALTTFYYAINAWVHGG